MTPPPPPLSLPLSAASETGSDYHPIFFNQDRLLEELFCVCIQLLNKTWKEMRATQEDFDKVSDMWHLGTGGWGEGVLTGKPGAPLECSLLRHTGR